MDLSRKARRGGFTLVELLVVIGIIALLIGILLPALGKAREASKAVKCGSNMHQIGIAMAIYLADNKSIFPASYIYVGHQIDSSGNQTPTNPDHGYIHWSSYFFTDYSDAKFKSANPYGIAIGAPGPYADAGKWGMFQCPSIENGGLPPCNTTPGNHDAGVQNDVAGYVDYQAPRMAYTLNEVICPRNKFTLGFQGCVRTEHFVRSSAIRTSANVILAAEYNPNPAIVVAPGEDSGAPAYKSHRPVNGFVGIGSIGGGYQDLVDISPGSPGTIIRVTKDMLAKNPTGTFTSGSRLDWVGRNHGNKKLDASGWNLGKSNFLYVDGHVEMKDIRDTLSPFQWGETAYSLDPNNDVLNQ
jgi:prepilin-type N-terminal cleavage/methylation domain-containing protein/prepilin-type processing-associated H-X9-DG protein